jgi:hypothetical protein
MPAQQLAMQDLLCTECSTALNDDTRSNDLLQVCDECISENTGYCEFCGDYYMLDWDMSHRASQFGATRHAVIMHVQGETICSNCTHPCPNCDTDYAYEESMWECCPEEENHELHSYSFKPSMRFWSGKGIALKQAWYPKPGELYMGLEIEMEKAAGYVHEMVDRDSQEDWHSPNFYYWKSDGSLSDSGAEMVTMPATLEAHKMRFPFEQLDWLHDKGARAWSYSTCGMHIHVSRSAFSATHMWKFIKFQLHNARALARIAGRDSTQWASWRNDTMDDARASAAKYTKDIRRQGVFANRYSALNFNNQDTVELRYFRSNISTHGILRNIELVHGMWAYTAEMDFASVFQHGWSFTRFVDYMRSYPTVYGNIIQYIEREGIA